MLAYNRRYDVAKLLLAGELRGELSASLTLSLVMNGKFFHAGAGSLTALRNVFQRI
jgi:hypothetical protein